MNVGEFRRRVIDRAALLNVTLGTSQIDQLQTYFELLERWNRRINLTSLSLEPLGDETLNRLINEPLAATRYVQASPLTWFDLGSGGGSPAIPMRVLRPQSRLTMVEARAKKAAFLREVARELKLANSDVINVRLEDWSPTPHSARLVTSRALRIDTHILSLVRRFLRADGQLFLFGSNRLSSTDMFREAREVALIPGLSSLTICLP